MWLALWLEMCETGTNLSLMRSGPSIFAMGLCLTGPLTHIWDYSQGDEETSVYKILGFVFCLAGFVIAIALSWEDEENIVLGTIATTVFVIGVVGYFVVQKRDSTQNIQLHLSLE
eukprot:UN19758